MDSDLSRLALAVLAPCCVGSLLLLCWLLKKTLVEMLQPSIFGLNNLARMFGLTTNKAAFSAVCRTGNDREGSRHANVLWGTNRLVSCALGNWKDGILLMFA